jgi:hypothetical protein
VERTSPAFRIGSRARRLALGAALVLVAAPAGAQAPPPPVRVTVAEPVAGAVIRAPVHQARIAGSALANAAGPDAFDVMLVIDVSDSTKLASGVDVDGDGVVGIDPHNELLPPGAIPSDVYSTDPQDTIFQAELRAARALLEGLDPRRVNVGVVTFAGEVDPTTGKRKRIDQQDAWLELPLTNDYAKVGAALDGVLARGHFGATNFSAGIRLGIVELAGLAGARSQPRPHAKKVMLFMTDGFPTLPVGKGNVSDPGDEEAAARAAQLAQQAGISINTYALGQEALKYRRSVTEIARITRGTYTPVQNPGDIVLLLGGVSFANVEDVVLTNLTTGELSTDVRLAPDGSFTGYLPVRDGKNRVRVIALASDGQRGAAEFDLEFQQVQGGPRDRLAELERIRRQNKELEIHKLGLEIESFRKEQKKRLEIEAEKGAEKPEGQ